MEVIVLVYSYNHIELGYQEFIEVCETIDIANKRIEELKKTIDVWDTSSREYKTFKRKVLK